jgi:hypothetical protein
MEEEKVLICWEGQKAIMMITMTKLLMLSDADVNIEGAMGLPPPIQEVEVKCLMQIPPCLTFLVSTT